MSRVAVDHFGITVPDLDQAVAFFVEAFGFDVVLHAAYDDLGYVWPGNAGPEKVPFRLAILKLTESHNIELLEYSKRESAEDRPAPQPADRGGMHLAFYVDDIYEFASKLEAREDITVLAPVQVEDADGPLDGLIWSYVLTDFGVVIELIQWGQGLPLDRSSARRMVPAPWRREFLL